MVRLGLLVVMFVASSVSAMVSPGNLRKELHSSGTLCTIVKTINGKKYIPKGLVVKVKDDNLGKTTCWAWNDHEEINPTFNQKLIIKIEKGFIKIAPSEGDTFIHLSFDQQDSLKSEKIVAPDNTVWFFEHIYNPRNLPNVIGSWVKDESN